MILHAWHPTDCETPARSRYVVTDVTRFQTNQKGTVREYERGGRLHAFSASDKYNLYSDDMVLIESSAGAPWAHNSRHA